MVLFSLLVIRYDETMVSNGSFAPSGPQPVQELVQHHGGNNLIPSQISPRMASPLISSPQQMMVMSPSQPANIVTSSRLPSGVVTTQQPIVTPRQSPVVLSARNPGQVFNGGQTMTTAPTPVNPVQPVVAVANQVYLTSLLILKAIQRWVNFKKNLLRMIFARLDELTRSSSWKHEIFIEEEKLKTCAFS